MFEKVQLPPLENYEAQLKALLKEKEIEISELKAIKNKTYRNFAQPIEYIFQEISDFTFPISHFSSLQASPRLEELSDKNIEILQPFYKKFDFDKELYEGYKSLLGTQLDYNKKRKLELAIQSFEESGLNLPKEKQEKLQELQQELSKLTNKFSSCVRKEQQQTKFKASLAHFNEAPESLLQNFKQGNELKLNFTALAKNLVFSYCDSSKIREEYYEKSVQIAKDNAENIRKQIELKKEISQLLGHSDYREKVLEHRMLNSVEKVEDFLVSLRDKIWEEANNDLKTIGEDLKPWDVAYKVRKWKKENLNFDQEYFREFFKPEKVFKYLEKLVPELVPFQFAKQDIESWHDDVIVYDILYNGKPHARIYFDLFYREGKKPGGWMNPQRSRFKTDEKLYLAVCHIVCNFDHKETLYLRDIETIFHELGHALQHTLSWTDDIIMSGIGGYEWDAVEWASQFVELLATERNALYEMSEHIETKDKLTQEDLDILEKNKSAFEAWGYTSSLFRSILDLKIWSPELKSGDYRKLIKDLRSEWSLIEVPEYNAFEQTFSHIFAGGYSCGYYSYLWSQVLAAESFLQFKSGQYDSDKWSNYFWCRGSELPAAQNHHLLFGHKPDPDALLKVHQPVNTKADLKYTIKKECGGWKWQIYKKEQLLIESRGLYTQQPDCISAAKAVLEKL